MIANQTPSACSALCSYIASLPLIFPNHPHTTFTLLLQLVNLNASEASHGGGNLLFEEDPLNNYMEEIVVLTEICHAMKTLISVYHEQLHKPLLVVTEQLCSLANSLQMKLPDAADTERVNSEAFHNLPAEFSPWEKQDVFLALCKVCLLAGAIVDGVVEAGHLDSHVFTEQLRDLAELRTQLLSK